MKRRKIILTLVCMAVATSMLFLFLSGFLLGPARRWIIPFETPMAVDK